MKKYPILLTCLFLLAFPTPVFAQEPGPSDGGGWGEVFSVQGVPLFDQMTDLGEVQVDVDWMEATILGQDVLDASFHMYQTDGGQVVAMPSALTLAHMAANPETSGFDDAQYLANGAGMQLIGTSIIVSGQLSETLSGVSETGLWAQLQEAYSSPGNFFKDIINGKPLALASPGNQQINLLEKLSELSLEDQNVYTALLLFEDCSLSPIGCPTEEPELKATQVPTTRPTPIPTKTPPPIPTCPLPSVNTGTPTASIQVVAPPNPLVVGQDPEKRGADILVEATVPPVIYTFYSLEEIYEEECSYLPAGIDPALPWGGEVCEDVLVGYECLRHTQSYPDRIISLTANAQLSPESKDWILNELSQSWYEAGIYRESFDLVPAMTAPMLGCGGNGTCTGRALVEKIPFADPGKFNLSMRAMTAGTPVSEPRSFTGSGEAEIWVTLVTLLED